VALADPSGVEFGRGLTNYNSHDARRIAGRKTEEIAAILGNMKYEEVIHVDNLVVTVTGD
jgi:glutamate 5-kinase